MLTVYIFKKEEYLKSRFADLEVNVPYGTYVAYDEETETLYYEDDQLSYSTESFIQDILNSSTEEMSLELYLDNYKERMSKLHADAPVLNTSKAPSEFDPVNPFQRLIDAGVNFRIQ